MEFKEVVSKRRTVRDFQTKEVGAEIIDYAIENGFKAPSYNHLREWEFIIINRFETKLKVIESENLQKTIDLKQLENTFLNEELIAKEMYLSAIPKQKKMILEAPSVVVAVYKPKSKVNQAKSVYDLNCLASVWACIENFLLSLAEYDVFGVTFIPQHTESLKATLGIPDVYEIAAVIPIGYREEDAKTPTQKTIQIAERKHYERW
jgi:nitroreductase